MKNGSWTKLILYGWDYQKYWYIRNAIYCSDVGKLKKKIYS